LQPLKDRAERILKDLESRKTTGLAAMDLLATLAAERDTAANSARESGLSPKAFAVTWALRNEPSLKVVGIEPKEIGREIEALLKRFPNAQVNADEQRRLRASLYRPLLKLPTEERTRIVDLIVGLLLS
jgi:type I restriction enzyme, R subunit